MKSVLPLAGIQPSNLDTNLLYISWFAVGVSGLETSSPAPSDLCLPSQLGDHREQRHVKRNDDAAYHHAQKADDDWF